MVTIPFSEIMFCWVSGRRGWGSILRWREFAFLVTSIGSLKRKDVSERQLILSDYDTFINWIETVPRDGDRQFRHMLRFFAFPDRVERMSSNGDRRAILVVL